ncbi:hypothetical protein PDIDSM_2412 [Penicillium digitatum]|nr:hypothetical protein PDIDSM_2412 [Penicillium digitatum]
MATMTDAVYQGRKPMKSRNIALLSVCGVISGTLLMFRLLAPQRGMLNTKEEIAIFQGGKYGQTEQGKTFGHTARPPRKGHQVPRGSV